MSNGQRSVRVLVPRLFDAANINAQILNARALVARFGDDSCEWLGAYYRDPDPAVRANPRVKLIRLWRRRFWTWRMALLYQQSADAIFYPGVEWHDEIGLWWRRRLHRRIPVIATLEGLVGDAERERMLSRWAGHPVYCHRVDRKVIDRMDFILGQADHVIAISSFLADMGRRLYGDKFSVLPLGIEPDLFYPSEYVKSERCSVVSAGTVYSRKRPEVFLELAERFPQAQFQWIGDGEQRQSVIAEAARRRLGNLSFPGARSPRELAAVFRAADVFVLPSRSEGVPKVTQEAAACGLPVILFGHYEAPSVVDGRNGYVVWSDRELERRLEALLQHPEKRKELGRRGAEMAKEWNWDMLAGRWEDKVRRLIVTSEGKGRR